MQRGTGYTRTTARSEIVIATLVVFSGVTLQYPDPKRVNATAASWLGFPASLLVGWRYEFGLIFLAKKN